MTEFEKIQPSSPLDPPWTVQHSDFKFLTKTANTNHLRYIYCMSHLN